MIGIVIVGHGGLARELQSALEHVMGPQPALRSVSISNSDDRTAKQAEICIAADEVDTGDGVVILTDLFGASPSNLSLKACQPRNRRIIYGMNLPMLIKLVKSRQQPLPDAVRRALEAGRKYIDSQSVSVD